MATRIKMLKLLQEMRGFAQVTNRRPLNRHPGLLALQIRSHVSQTTAAKRKHTIFISMLEPTDIPHPVKIVHLEPQPAASEAIAPEV
jgi:hypothetical protein